MEKATMMQDLLRVINTEPLKGTALNKFRVETCKARGRDSARILRDFFKANRGEIKKVLFMGHRGSGKSTELYQLGEYLKDSFSVINFSIKKEIDTRGMKYTDLIFVILEKLFSQAVEEKIKIDEGILDNIYNYWNDEKLNEIYKFEKSGIEISAEAKTSFISNILGNIKGTLATGKESKEIIRRHIEPKLSRLIDDANDLIQIIRMGMGKQGKMPIIIIEDLDKLSISDAKDLFLNHSDVLTDLKIHIVYTFPIFLNYSIEFNEIKGVFERTELLSMIKVNNPDGTPYDIGRGIIKEIVERRANAELFEPEALDFIIEKSGGALRSVFEMILNAALIARSNDEDTKKVDFESAKKAYVELRSDFERIIFRKHIDVLKRIYNKNGEEGMADENMMEMLSCSAIIEYNGERWCDLHPAVKDMLERKGLV